ncbi:thioredoxin H-type 1-like [Telopea speciosissima]|uniref:thioredoxin H-type 1-like n=1 Tax=Telopea speciosissima TaxID=54955 RepID=UPI001CC6887B|nr:thioredoxin H-type 1-like [Telopea speciosissima]
MAGKVIVCSNIDDWNQYKPKEKVLAFFTAPWSGQAHKIAPIVRDLAREYPHVNVVQLDLRQFELTAKEYNVNSAPTLLFMKGGKTVDKVETSRPYQLYDKMDILFAQ